MEYEDVWKQSLGSDLYKERPNILAIDHPSRKLIAQHTREQPVRRDDSNGILGLLFKDGKGHLHDSWKQGFYFDQSLKYGLFQNKGGPCGILATVQAFFLKHLLYGAKMQLHYLDQKNFSNSVQNCLALAIAEVLCNASNWGETNVRLVIPQAAISSAS
mmetsp:Transcript_8439/g.14145  ORF Transcript_8439/g.14145 Transcript_8439/m.14145 type:complete len:159 (+) Transcript_8439:1864-2340(+)